MGVTDPTASAPQDMAAMIDWLRDNQEAVRAHGELEEAAMEALKARFVC